ncbi:hypothetical protein Scep_025279 [Stephania cephalantha]|uniref:Uncharacterized protein n=1 Tax=Stephania cephalantha TaxID=152367 RepID=A0AAP0HSC0_9MAGN
MEGLMSRVSSAQIETRARHFEVRDFSRMLPWHILMGGDRWCVLYLEVLEEPGSSRRSRLVAEEPGLSRRSPPYE